jgi:Ca2+-binding RTX toxin-like protein
LSNVLAGNAAANRLDGGAGPDMMAGAGGNDVYVVNDLADQVVELAGGGVDSVEASVSHTLGEEVEHLTLTGTAAISGAGNGLANILTGNGAANSLIGGGGADTMRGGAGDDTYSVDDAGDSVEESPGNGKDLVRSSVTFTLGANVEKLSLIGSAAADATGNGLNNFLVGNSAANVLDGGAGADAMAGGAGNDWYMVDNLGDRASENSNEGTDTVQSSVSFALSAHVENLILTGAAAIDGSGNSLANAITGNSAANLINGGGGADTMAGGDGNDIYIVDNIGDTATEVAGEGTDLVKSNVTFMLGADIEKLTLRGGAAIDGTGNVLANTLAGNEAANVLDGGAGADRLLGAGGNDTYVIDHVGDQAIETSSGGGTDTVLSAVTFTLGDHVERLTLTGAAATNGTGNDLANLLAGNGSANVLDGGRGNDTLQGGGGDDSLRGGLGNDSLRGDAGADDFVFAKPLGATNVDHVFDFATGSDDVVLENAVFKGLAAGGLNPNALRIGSAAADADDRIVYDPATGNLFYDADGAGGVAQILFAVLDTRPAALAAGDFAVI